MCNSRSLSFFLYIIRCFDSQEGMKALFEIGRMMRKRYVKEHKILSSAYTAKEVGCAFSFLINLTEIAYVNRFFKDSRGKH